MLDLFQTFLAQPESAAVFIEELKAGNISIKWEEIVNDSEKLANIHELTFGLMMHAADNAKSLNAEKLTPIIGKLFILNRNIESAAAQQETDTLNFACNEFDATLRTFAGLINLNEAVESIRLLQEQTEEDMQDASNHATSPFFTVILALRMLVHAHEIEADDFDASDEDIMAACDEDDDCCEY